MQYNKIQLPVVGSNPAARKLKVKYVSGQVYEINAYAFQFKPEYMPKMVWCIVSHDKEGGLKFTQDLNDVLQNIYEEECEYEFKVVSVKEDSLSHKPYLLLHDQYGIQHKLYGVNVRRASSAVGKIISCEVSEIKKGYLVLKSSEYQEGVDRVIADESISRIAVSELELFDKLHDKRVRQYKSMNDRSMRGIWMTVIDKYPDSVHFIYELLQNADDAEATEVTIYLDKDALYFKHNGSVQFTITDDDDESVPPGHINAIVGIGNSTKDDGNKIGKFGVGFKAVFQYTDSPVIYTDNFKFRIVNYIVPELVQVDCRHRKQGETLFEIPFKYDCYGEILDKLNHLKSPILFLKHIQKVIWQDKTKFNHEKVYSKETVEKFTDKDVRCEHIIENDVGVGRHLWLFSRKVRVDSGVVYPVCVGYFLKNDSDKLIIDTDIRPEVFCFFATSEKFGSCFISHAPFLLVDNRQQVKDHEKVNVVFRDAICELAADALVILRDIGVRNNSLLIDDNIFQIIPLNTHYIGYYEDSLISNDCLFTPMLNKLKTSQLLLTRSKQYANPGQIRLAVPVSLAEVLDTEQLSSLNYEYAKVDFLDKAPVRYTAESDYLMEQLEVKRFTSEDLAKCLTPEYMAARTFEWVVRLYRFLYEDAKELWNANSRNANRGSLSFRHAPIVKTTQGQWVAPYNGENVNVFFAAGEDSSDYNIVADEYYKHEPARKFLMDLGVKEPDMWDYIKTHVISHYMNERISLTTAVQLSDFETLLHYSGKIEADKLQDLYTLVREKVLLRGVNHGGQIFQSRIERLYYPSKELKRYFEGYAEHAFLDVEFYSPLIKKYTEEKVCAFLRSCGLAFSPRIIKKTLVSRYALTDAQRKELGDNDFSYNDKEYGTDYQMEGLQNALERNLNRALSVQIWNWLCAIDNIEDYRYLSFKFHYYSFYDRKATSSLLSLLTSTPWVYVNQRTKKLLDDISQEQFEALPDYNRSYSLYGFFGVVRKSVSLEELGADQEQIKSYRNGKALEQLMKENGLSFSEVESLLKKGGEQKRKKEEKEKSARENGGATPHKDMKDYSANEMFDDNNSSGRKNSGQETSETRKDGKQVETAGDDAQVSERIEEIKKKQQEEIDRKQKQEELRVKASSCPRYSKEWFESLLSLECEHEGDNVETFGRKAVSITFTKVCQDPESDRIYVLKYPSRTIPLEIEQIGGLEVSFSFYDLEDLKLGFEVASVRDFSLRLKAKLVDADKLKDIDWSKCSKAEVQINNSVALVEKLSQAFAELELPDGADLKEMLPDNFSFVFGPPGTGKTTCLAEKICNLMSDAESECRILALAPTNKACDVLACKVADMAPSTEWLGRFLTGSERLEEDGLVIDKTSDLYQQPRCCIVTTMARLPYDGFGIGYDMDCFRDIQWDYVIIDEASMIPLAQIVYAIYKFTDSQIIIAGDPKQIAPIVREEAWKKENIYTMVNLQRFKNPVTEPRQFVIENLETQYRAIPQIGRVFSEYAYDGLLKHNRKPEEQRQLDIKGLDFLKPVNFITFKVNRYDDICAPRKLSSSNVHVYSVIFLVELCKYIFRMYEKGKAKKDSLSIGIICPYAAQAQMIDKLLEQCSDIPSYIRISVGTIHGFQGDECDVVFVMFNPPRGLKGATDRVLVNDPNIINVAVSRARDYLFVLMPEKEMYGFECLREIIAMGQVVTKDASSFTLQTADKMEQIIFGEVGHIEKNTFVTTHQLANVYSKPASQYEVRIDESSVDIQVE